jgi:hypothetical protein
VDGPGGLVLIERYFKIGPRWVKTGRMLPGRSANSIKNRRNKHLLQTAGQPLSAHACAIAMCFRLHHLRLSLWKLIGRIYMASHGRSGSQAIGQMADSGRKNGYSEAQPPSF